MNARETFAKLNTLPIKLQNEYDLSSRTEASCTVMRLQMSRVLSREVDVFSFFPFKLNFCYKTGERRKGVPDQGHSSAQPPQLG